MQLAAWERNHLCNSSIHSQQNDFGKSELFFSQRKISTILISGRCSYQRIKRGIELRCVSLAQCSRIAFKVGIPFLAYHFMVM